MAQPFFQRTAASLLSDGLRAWASSIIFFTTSSGGASASISMSSDGVIVTTFFAPAPIKCDNMVLRFDRTLIIFNSLSGLDEWIVVVIVSVTNEKNRADAALRTSYGNVGEAFDLDLDS